MAYEQESFQSLLLVTALILFFPFCCSIDTISPYQPLRDGESLISAGENFALGFFSPGNSKNRYVGIWFNKIPEKTVVWVANRENPVTDSSGILIIEGINLVLFHGSANQTAPLWSTHTSTVTNCSSSTARLMDSGNLVLRDDQQRVLWESFDYPTNTFLPGMKLGLDRKTGLQRRFTSWKSPEDPAPGEMSFGLDPQGMPQYFVMKGSDPIWRTGPWNGKSFSGVYQMDRDPILSFFYTSNDDEIYHSYALKPRRPIVSIYILVESGEIRWLMWSDKSRRWNLMGMVPADFCGPYGRCGVDTICDPYHPYVCECLRGFEPKAPRDWAMRDWSKGCVRRKPLDCEGKTDGFVKLARVKLPDTSAARVEPGLSLKACEEECLKTCSCTAYAAADITNGDNGCVMWDGDLIDIRIIGEERQVLYTRVAASELDLESGGRSVKKKLTITLLTSLMLAALVTCSYLVWRKSKGRLARRSSDMLLNENDFEDNGSGPEVPMFDLSVIKVATNNFSEANIVGKGGFGVVYKGKLSNGQEIATKRLSQNSRQGAQEFKNEVALIAKLQHKNLVRLLGYYIGKREKILIYEFMQNKSLDTFIFDQARKVTLDWKARFNIILGIARGVLYLHEDSRFKVIHRDLKVSNILLDSEMNPKISDFGIARVFGGEQTHANTINIAGTCGYMSPEYAIRGHFSIKSDVFSFGVLLLEIISGRRNNNFCGDSLSISLIGHAWRLWVEGSVLELVDLSIKDSSDENEVLRCIQVGLLCVQESAKARPSMSNVVFMLGNEMKIPSPKQPAFCFQSTFNDQDVTGCCSANEVTITELNAR